MSERVSHFEVFWAAYPCRPDNPKAAARTMFERRVREGADGAAIAAAAGRYAASVKARKLDSAFVPHARTWLSQRRYEDYGPDAPVSADDRRPNPEHPLYWMIDLMGEAAWMSWISPVGFRIDDEGRAELTFRTMLAAQHVFGHWQSDLVDQYGAPITSIIARNP